MAAVMVAFALAVAMRQPVPDDFVVILARTSCFGECPVYGVRIDAKGDIAYDGKKFVRVEGRQTDRVPVARVAALMATVQRIGFFGLEESYRSARGPDGKGISITDRPTTFVSVTAGGRSKWVEDYLGAPESLRQLERLIDQTARTKRWITLDEPTFHQMLRDGWSPSPAERQELLRKALQDDDPVVTKALLEIGADPDGLFFATNEIPLMMAQSAAAARVLLDAGANPRARSSGGETALERAANYAPSLTEVLLKAGAPVDNPDESGHAALLQASCIGNAGVVKLLLNSGADPRGHPGQGREGPLDCARSMQPYERLYPQRLIDVDPPFIKDYDGVIALLEEAVAKRERK